MDIFHQICGLLCVIGTIFSQVCTDLNLLGNKIYRGFTLNGRPFMEINNMGLVQCMNICIRHELCSAITSNNDKCLLLSGEAYDLISNQHWITSNASTWPTERLAGYCFNHDCPSNSQCVVKSNSYICDVVGCVEPPSINHINITSFKSKPLWIINDSVTTPCLDGHISDGEAVCQQNGQWRDFKCSLPKNCEDAVRKHLDLNIEIEIDLDGENGTLPTLSVRCESTQNGTVKTIIEHHSGNFTARGFELPYSQQFNVNYTADMGAMTYLINSSSWCSQKIIVECRGQVITGQAAWVTRHGTRAYYFTGYDVNYVGCSCGRTRSCSVLTKNCNCDKNDYRLRYDEGYITNKDDLPISGLLVGDTGDFMEYGTYHIGPLICEKISKICGAMKKDCLL